MSDTTTTTFFSPSFPSFRSIFQPTFWLGGSWKKEVVNSNLPSEIQSLVRRVVLRSRLTRREKFDVAEELIQHFQDGNQKGLSFEKLVDKFGDPEAAATLIRRSKLRNRNLFVTAARMIPPTMACFSIAYLILLWHYHHGQPNPNVDYTAELNRNATETAEEDKAWPVYRSMWTKYQFGEGAQGEFGEMRKQMWFEDEDTKERLVRPSDEQWPQAVDMLKQHKELLDAFRETATLKSHGLRLQPDPRNYSDEDFAALHPTSEKENFNGWTDHDPDGLFADSMASILLPHVQPMREAARLLYVDTRQAVLESDANRVIQNIETVLGLANQTAESPILVNTLVAIAVSRIGIEQLEEVITDNPDFFSESQLAQLQDKLQKTDIRSWLDYEGEHLMLKDIVQRCYTDNGNGDGRMTAAGMKMLNSGFLSAIDNSDPFRENELVKFAESVIAPTTLFTCASRKEVLAKAEELYEELEADQKTSFWKSKSSKTDGWKDFDDFFQENRTEHILLAIFFPAFQQVRAAVDRSVAQKNGVLTALAMYRYRLRNKRWPETKDDLVPKFLDRIPVDILTGKPLHFKIIDDRPLVYSVGMDHDDDGGIDAVENKKSIKRSEIKPGPKNDNFEGDWILWPLADPTDL